MWENIWRSSYLFAHPFHSASELKLPLTVSPAVWVLCLQMFLYKMTRALPSCLINLKNDTPCQTDTPATQGRRAEAFSH